MVDGYFVLQNTAHCVMGVNRDPLCLGGGLARHDVFRKPLLCFYSNWLCILPSQITHEARLQKTINSSMLISRSRARLHQPGCFFLPNYCAIKPMTAPNPARASFYEPPHTFLQHGKQTVNTRNVLHFNG